MRGKLTALMAATTIAAIPVGVQPQAQFYYSDPPTNYGGQMGNAAPGGYWYAPQMGNFGAMGSGYPTGNANGQYWNYWSNGAGMGVGGDGKCIYTTEGWSNC
jgi:hypothetical protein